MIQKERIKFLNTKTVRNCAYVLYWMQASQRTEYNHALEYSIMKANELNKPIIVLFCLTDDFPEANLRHYNFMIEGLKETEISLEKRKIKFIIEYNQPPNAVEKYAKEACIFICDCGYLRIQKSWRDNIAKNIDCCMIQVESDVIVPVESASIKEEFSAGTLRPKIKNIMQNYLYPLKPVNVKFQSLYIKIGEQKKYKSLDDFLLKSNLDKTVKKSPYYKGGLSEAKKYLNEFIHAKIDHFHDLRNDPSKDYLSNMSPYLHFGQISPLYIALKAKETKSGGLESFLEELIIRRELSMNFVNYNDNYDKFECLPDWAKKTLVSHKSDIRQFIYSIEDFENAKTHDIYWNAAQKEMMITGKMHGYMRMYWGKKILEWSETPEEAFNTALHLNNKYELDGRDPNGFAGVAWCFGKHDRAWGERKIFGKIRYMNDKGLKRKFDIDEYVQKVDRY